MGVWVSGWGFRGKDRGFPSNGAEPGSIRDPSGLEHPNADRDVIPFPKRWEGVFQVAPPISSGDNFSPPPNFEGLRRHRVRSRGNHGRRARRFRPGTIPVPPAPAWPGQRPPEPPAAARASGRNGNPSGATRRHFSFSQRSTKTPSLVQVNTSPSNTILTGSNGILSSIRPPVVWTGTVCGDPFMA